MVLQNPLQYLTFVLHPNHNRANPEYREFLILDYLVQRPFPGAFRLDGEPNWDSMFSMDELLLRAIANGLGFIDESNRGGVPGDGGNVYWPAECRNDGTHNDNDLLTPDPVGGVFLSDADPYSVTTHPRAMKDIMALPQCSGSRPRGYALSYRDVMGAACQYRELNPLYYCAQYAQNSIASRYGADCSPFPLSAGGPGDCGTNSDESFWQDPKRASDFNQAILDAIQ